jgi:putative FmdB family regulatory protein
MPTYEYECKHCGHTFDSFHKITADPLTDCPKCGKELRRLFGGGLGIIFKGSGFYTTDYKRSSAVSNGNGSSRKSSKDESKSESKSEAKKDPSSSGSKPS